MSGVVPAMVGANSGPCSVHSLTIVLWLLLLLLCMVTIMVLMEIMEMGWDGDAVGFVLHVCESLPLDTFLLVGHKL